MKNSLKRYDIVCDEKFSNQFKWLVVDVELDYVFGLFAHKSDAEIFLKTLNEIYNSLRNVMGSVPYKTQITTTKNC